MKSISPYADKFEHVVDFGQQARKIDSFVDARKTVVVQGLGFVGSAMVAALSNARSKKNETETLYKVIGVDLPDESNYWKIARVNNGRPPLFSCDKNIDTAYMNGRKNNNIMATYSEYAYSKAEIIIVDIHLGIEKKKRGNPYDYNFSHRDFKKSIEIIAKNIAEDTLVVIETTVPPGTTEKLIYPIFKDLFKKRGLDISRLYIVYSYERVMPGPKCLNSISDFYRVYSGINSESNRIAREFFESFINTEDFPLYEIKSPTACEMAKVLENTYRVVNIAFIQEWTEYAQRSGVNLFEVIDAIRVRPTHGNIMYPGFGVGGYCLPKDTLFADYSSTELFGGNTLLGMSLGAIAINDLMPDYTFRLLKENVGDLKGKRITILGVSYLQDVADTRYSPTEYFYERCLSEGAVMNLHDSVVTFWKEKNIDIDTDIKHLSRKQHDIVVFAVRHKDYLDLTAEDILSILPGVKVIIDANNIITDDQAAVLSGKGIEMVGVGKGHWRSL